MQTALDVQSYLDLTIALDRGIDDEVQVTIVSPAGQVRGPLRLDLGAEEAGQALASASRPTGAWLKRSSQQESLDPVREVGAALFASLFEVFFAQKIRRLLEGRPLVFLNACESGRTANEKRPQEVKQYLQKPAEGLASSFIYGGALGCIGALWPIYDKAAAEFALEFYGRVLEGHMIGEAMRQARVRSREAHPQHITWAAFVLYGDPTFRLVD